MVTGDIFLEIEPKVESESVLLVPSAVESIAEHLRKAIDGKYHDTRPLWGAPRLVSKGWTPSSIGEPNDRLLAAGLLGYRGDEISQRLYFIFEAGNDIESRWIKRFQSINWYESSGGWVPRTPLDGLTYSGKVDIIIRDPKTGTRFIVEVKSISPEGFRALPPVSVDPEVNIESLLTTTGITGDRVRKYIIQLQLYLHTMKVDDGILLFDNKGNQDYAAFHICCNDSVMNNVTERLTKIQTEYWSKNLLPPWNGGSTRHFLAKYKPTEAITLEEAKQLTIENTEEF